MISQSPKWKPRRSDRGRGRTLSIADANDPALIVAKARGRTEVVVVLDDHLPPEAYWALLPGGRGDVLSGGQVAASPLLPELLRGMVFPKPSGSRGYSVVGALGYHRRTKW